MLRCCLWIGLLVWVIARAADAADCSGFPNLCDPNAGIVTQTRTGLQRPNACYCPYDVPMQANIDIEESKGCFEINGILNCGPSLVQGFPVVLDPVVATLDNFEFLIAPHAMTLRAVGCHCDANCTTTATFSFATRAGNAIGLTGGGDLTCSSSSSDTVPITFNTSDGDRILPVGRGVRLSTTNSPTADQRVVLIFQYMMP